MGEQGIAIGKRHTLLHDDACWVVVTHPTKGSRTREDKKGNAVLVGNRNYYLDLGVALRRIYNSNLRGVKTIEDIMVQSEEHFKQLLAVGEEIRDAVAKAQKNVLEL